MTSLTPYSMLYRNNLFCLFVIFIISFNNLFGQESRTDIFDQSFIHEIKIYFHEPDFDKTLDKFFKSAEKEGDKQYLCALIVIDGIQIDSVGIRYKGNSSYSNSNLNNPFKIDFNEFIKDQKFNGLKKLNLNTTLGDASLSREFVALNVMRDMNLLGPRISYSQVYINDKYHGLYYNVEQVDDFFIKKNFNVKEPYFLFKTKDFQNIDRNQKFYKDISLGFDQKKERKSKLRRN